MLTNSPGTDTTGPGLKKAFGTSLNKLIEKYNSTLPPGLEYMAEGLPNGGLDVYRGIKGLALNNLYAPASFSALASIILSTIKEDWASAISASAGTSGGLNTMWNLGSESSTAITCVDSSFRAESVDDMYSSVQAQLLENSWGDNFVLARSLCGAWPFISAEPIDLNISQNVKTSVPVLFVNGPFDPVTSLSSAWQTSMHFRESRLVVHHGVGVSDFFPLSFLESLPP